MSDPHLDASTALRKAYSFYNLGKNLEARKYASAAIQIDPNTEEAWLILAALGTPQASVAYAKAALRINPNSIQARNGLTWAYNRLKANQGEPPAAEIVQSDFQAFTWAAPAAISGHTQIREKSASPKGANNSLLFWIMSFILIMIIVCGGASIWVFIPNNLVVLADNYSQPHPSGILEKPTLTPTSTVTPTPTATNSPIPTATLLPTYTASPTLTFTNISPTETNQISSAYFDSLSELYPDDQVTSGKWIDVNLSFQSLAAYEGEEIIQSFIVSTGLPGTPTVTGEFAIYAKYPAVLMSGPGYYLPDVPYTMYFYTNYGLHGTYWHNNFGSPMSHGCVNLATPDAEWLYTWAAVGTPVIIHY